MIESSINSTKARALLSKIKKGAAVLGDLEKDLNWYIKASTKKRTVPQKKPVARKRSGSVSRTSGGVKRSRSVKKSTVNSNRE